ncbi:N-acetyltransferase [Bacillus sp. M6-12]|uniref:GNAT family N-acetyltransferase n=1 Tax=Bacillus sp. M6-12 TaxID=2054166 RepID=UPI000C778D1B|nr:GNAT family N-acetyltransferase [Bacillus sp. M6-12]PLS19224.1 N-acetyltransferase [Bacillus sp. M6-12]
MSNQVVFKKVFTQEEKDIFHQVKKDVWEGTGYDMEYGREGSDLYIAYVNGIPGGTFEFTPYSQFTRPFMRELFDDVVQKDMTVVELDSFAVLPEYRGLLGREIVRFMIFYAQTYGYTHGIGISAPSVFKSFNNTYHIRGEQVKESMWYKGDDVIPTLFYLKEVYDNLEDEKYAWYETPIEAKEEVVA